MDSAWLRQRLRELRKRCGLPQGELGQRANLSKQFISDVERGAKGLSVESLLRYVRGIRHEQTVVAAPFMRTGCDGARGGEHVHASHPQ